MKKKIVVIIVLLILIACEIAVGIKIKINNTLVDINEIATDSEFENITYDKVENIWDDEVLGILTIEKIGLNATIKEGSDSSILKDYIGHIEDTATYDGNIGLAAHNRGNKYSYFARINELEIGDIIIYQTKFYTRTYIVDNIESIFETDWKLLENTKENKLTLVTCIANKKKQRLVVQATERTAKDL